jgi:hypothetical protein
MKSLSPLSQITIAEKLRPMEAQFESPAWHGDVLHDRDEKIKSGKESFMDWEAAKKQLHDKLT